MTRFYDRLMAGDRVESRTRGFLRQATVVVSGTDTQGLPERWVNLHPDARAVLDDIIDGMAIEFLDHPQCDGLLLAPDRESYIMRVGVLHGARLISRQEAAALVRGMGVAILNPDEAEEEGGDDR